MQQSITEKDLRCLVRYLEKYPDEARQDPVIDEEDIYRDSKCDYCNCALRDCSLCGSDVEG